MSIFREPVDDYRGQGNLQYEGYVMDLLDALAKELNFTYQLDLIPDGKYGFYDKEKKEWNGVVRHIMDKKADMGVGDITITHERRQAVDFTMPFMTLGISILYAKPEKEAKTIFSFMKPFSNLVWLCIAASIFVLVILLFILSR